MSKGFDERTLIEQIARRTKADVVEFYEVGGVTPHYTIRKGRRQSAANAVANRLEPAARRDLLAALKKLKGNFDERAFASAYAKGDVDSMLRAFAHTATEASMRPALGVVLQGFQQAGAAAAGALSKDLRVGVKWSFDVTNNDAVEWGYAWSSELITSIADDVRDSVKSAVGRALDMDLSRRDATMLIRSVVGLNDRQAMAVERLRGDLVVTGAQASTIEAKTTAYANRLLSQRAELIARTEIMSAANAGQRAAWDQAAGKGLLDAKTTQREWILTDDDRLCEDCEDMDGVTVDFDDEFEPDGDPPLHPGCRCTTGLVFDK